MQIQKIIDHDPKNFIAEIRPREVSGAQSVVPKSHKKNKHVTSFEIIDISLIIAKNRNRPILKTEPIAANAQTGTIDR